MGLVSATPSRLNVPSMSPESGLKRGGVAEVGSMGMGLIATPLFGGVMVGSGGGQTSCKGMVGQKSLIWALGTGPINSSMCVAQSNETVGGMCVVFG